MQPQIRERSTWTHCWQVNSINYHSHGKIQEKKKICKQIEFAYVFNSNSCFWSRRLTDIVLYIIYFCFMGTLNWRHHINAVHINLSWNCSWGYTDYITLEKYHINELNITNQFYKKDAKCPLCDYFHSTGDKPYKWEYKCNQYD